MQERRQDIIAGGLAVLRETGFSGFTQPRVAARAGVRQSHLTYYFPTRVDLLLAVARVAVDDQLATLDAALDGSSPEAAAAAIAELALREENTRVLLALVQAADQEPALRELFRELTDGIVLRVGGLLQQLGVAPSLASRDLVQALGIGLAVTHLATRRPEAGERALAALGVLFAQLAAEAQPGG
jgi:AcrR family transcriptional regulator